METASPRPIAVSCSRKLSRDVELAALVSSVETTLHFQCPSGDVNSHCHASCVHFDDGIRIPCSGGERTIVLRFSDNTDTFTQILSDHEHPSE